MNMLLPFYREETILDTMLLQRGNELYRRLKRHNLVFVAVDDERRCRVLPRAQLGHWADRCHALGIRRLAPIVCLVRLDAVEHERKAAAFFEQGKDELGARVAGPDPS